MILSFFGFLMIGGVLMFFVRKFPPVVRLAQRIHFPIDCDLCLGFWVYLALAFGFGVSVFYPAPYTPFLDEIVTAATMSLVAHLIKEGWNLDFRVMQVG